MKRGACSLMLAAAFAAAISLPGSRVAADISVAPDDAQTRLERTVQAWNVGATGIEEGKIPLMIEAAQRLSKEGGSASALSFLKAARQSAGSDVEQLRTIDAAARAISAEPSGGVSPRTAFARTATLDDRTILNVRPGGRASADYKVGPGRLLLAVLVVDPRDAARVGAQLSVGGNPIGGPERMFSPASLQMIELPRAWAPGACRITVYNRGPLPAQVRLVIVSGS